jgi:tetratricopeptide (TPR) repeat protein/predicted Ser/Thr protein kinase
MTPERFQQIEELYHAARGRTAEERAALLAQTDPELRREIESLLEERSGDEFLDRPVIQNAPELVEDATVTEISAGLCLGPYRIESKLGEGGMGEVFRAIDTRLGRAVALKTTHERFSARFEREARAISSLNHPNICAIYDVGPNYFVMELVEGETIAARLKGGPLPMKTALSYASQIMAALVEAHGKGIVHRDLKPANVMIAKSGVKVLDFGLAKLGQDETVTTSRMVMGTPAYMAPEQREGKPADARSDLYSFGCVLYEMLTGARFGSQRRRISSRQLERIVDRCLEEDPGRRWQSAVELERELVAVTRPTSRRKRIVFAVAAILGLFAAAYFYLQRAPRLTEKDTIVLADFENKTGDPVFDGTLRQGLAVQLEESPFLSLVSDERIQRTLRLMSQPANSRLTPELAREICERTASAAVLEGSIDRLGSQYVLGLRAKSCHTGDILDQQQAQATTKEEVLHALSQIASKFRTRVGESLTTIEKHSTPLEEATTSSLEALKAYTAGSNANFAKGFDSAIPHFTRAITIDPQFAMAHGMLGFMYSNLGETDLAAESTRRAYQLRERASEREKFFISFLYDRQVTGNLKKGQQILESWAQTYPRDIYPPTLIGGWVALGSGEYEKGLQVSQKAIDLEPDNPFGYVGLVAHNLFLDRFEESGRALRLAAQRKVENRYFLVRRYYLAFYKGDQAEMERTVTLARGNPGAEDAMFQQQALVLARSGHMKQAAIMWQRAITLAQQIGHREKAALYETAAAACEAHFGNGAGAKLHALVALKIGKGRDVEYAAAFALAVAGDFSGAQTLADDLEERFPEDTPVQFEYLPTLRALFALARNDPSKAIELLQPALAYDFALPGTAFGANFGGLYPAYVRGKAYLAANHGVEAATEFRKILDHRGVVGADPVGALAHLQLGRAFALSGDKTEAKTAYQDFLTLWKDADPDIPILQQAKAEYAELR